MNKMILTSVGVLALTVAFTTAHAVAVWDGGAGTTDWLTANNWSPNSLPDGGDNTTLDSAGGVTVLSGADALVQVNNLTLRNGHVLTIDNSGYDLFVDGGSAINMGQGAPVGDGSTINLVAGTLRGTGTLTMSNNTTDYGTSFFNLSGTGILQFGTLSVGTAAEATFSVLGDLATATLSGGVNAYVNSTFNFTLGATGVTSIDAGGALAVTDGADLVIDGSSYIGGIADITLFDAASMTGTFNYDVQNMGVEGTDWNIIQGTDGDVVLNVIPEPATLGMVAATGLGILFIRRRLMM